jgi:3-oxoacyl-[acyl-carrier protein] reductase
MNPPKRVLVTGANKGIGRSVADLFLQKGYEVFSLSRTGSNHKMQMEKEIVFDLRQTNLRPVYESTGNIDILVNNAGIMHPATLETYTREQQEEILAVNLIAPLELSRLYLSGMVAQGGGRIINVASIAGHLGHPDIWYGITKAGMINMTKSIARSHGGKGIFVAAVAPGPVYTDMFDMIPQKRKDAMMMLKFSPKFTYPADVAKLILWLATEAPAHMSGGCFDINDGILLR